MHLLLKRAQWRAVIKGKSLAFVQRPNNVLRSPPPILLSLWEVLETRELKNFLSWWSERSYFTASDMQNLSPASGPLTAGKEKNPSPSPRVCIIFSWRWDAAVLAICCPVLGLPLSPLIWYLKSADSRHIWAAHGARWLWRSPAEVLVWNWARLEEPVCQSNTSAALRMYEMLWIIFCCQIVWQKLHYMIWDPELLMRYNYRNLDPKTDSLYIVLPSQVHLYMERFLQLSKTVIAPNIEIFQSLLWWANDTFLSNVWKCMKSTFLRKSQPYWWYYLI